MADDGLQRFEAVLGAISKITAGDEGPGEGLTGVCCPRCNASDFVKVSDAYDEAVRNGDEQLIERCGPPQRRSPVPGTLLFLVPLAAAAFYLYRQFGRIAGQIGGMVTFVATVTFLLTRARHLSDQYYDRRQQWNKLFMCRSCGQLVAP